MTGDCHVRFCERLRGETPLCLLGERKKKYLAPRISAGHAAKSPRRQVRRGGRQARSNFSNNERTAPFPCRNFHEKQIGCSFEDF